VEGYKHPRARRSKGKKAEQKSWLEEAKQLQARILARRGGQLLPDSTSDIRAMREDRTR
jgi:hypothetical protein